MSAPVKRSEYGDTDRRIPVTMGDSPEHDGASPDVYIGRRARIEGFLVLHHTIGGRPQWEWDEEGTTLTVCPRYTAGDVPSRITLRDLIAVSCAVPIVSDEHGLTVDDGSEVRRSLDVVLRRVVGEIAAARFVQPS